MFYGSILAHRLCYDLVTQYLNGVVSINKQAEAADLMSLNMTTWSVILRAALKNEVIRNISGGKKRC
jgi:hypothetical protein